MELRKSERLRSVAAALLVATLVTACSSRDSGNSQMPPPTGVNTAPTVASIANRSVDQDTVVGPVEFGVGDEQSDAALLTVFASVDSGAVIPVDGVALGGSGAVRSITLTPLEAVTGTATVTLVVTDPQGASSSRSFQVAVNARSASIRGAALTTFAKGEADEPTAVNGFTFAQDADDPAIFEPLIGPEEE